MGENYSFSYFCANAEENTKKLLFAKTKYVRNENLLDK
jgi:hypothetical protein